MEKFKELLEKLNEKEILCTDTSWEENIPSDIWSEYFGVYEEISHRLNEDQRTWYSVSTTVIEIFGKYLGIRHVDNTFSESQYPEDCGTNVRFFEMIEEKTVTYIRKE